MFTSAKNTYIFQHYNGLQVVDTIDMAAERLGVHVVTLEKLKSLEAPRNTRKTKLAGWSYIGVGPKPEREATLEWLLANGDGNPRLKLPEERADQSPVLDRLLLVLAAYQNGEGAKAISTKIWGDNRYAGQIIRVCKNFGVFEPGRKSPQWLGIGTFRPLSTEEECHRIWIKSFESDQCEWKRGVRHYERAIQPKDWRAQHRRMRASPELEIKFNLRKRLRHCAIDKQHSLKSVELFGCGMAELRAHLEAQFLPWMNWGNYGRGWHIDHKTPCRAFNLTDPEQAKLCFHYTNLQPMEAKENIRKSDLMPDGGRARNAA